jgi:ketosteroid isomerase-like protein
MTDLEDFKNFMRQREAAAQGYVNGDSSLLGRMVALRAPATFFGPGGGLVEGPPQVWARYEGDAKKFLSGRTRFEILHMHAAEGLAYWTGLQRASARMQGSQEEIPMDLRVTEVFRREGMEWKLVHRHADLLGEAK